MSIGKTGGLLPGVAVVGAAMLQSRVAGAARGRLLVFVQTTVKQRALQAIIQSALSELTVTAVGRIADFDRALEEAPDAVLTLPIVLAARGMSPQVRGYRNGAPDEPYALVAVDALPNPASVNTVGAVDLLGRDGTNGFVRALLGNSVKVERVTKVEDLLPLLQMQRADAVLIPSRLYSDLASTSSLHLVQHELPARVGLPAITGLGAGGIQAVDRVSKLAGEAARTLGTDSWR
jgi:hypothetical protein